MHWRHVKFIEPVQRGPERGDAAHDERRLQALRSGRLSRGLSHRRHHPHRFDTVVIQSDVCNGCRLCHRRLSLRRDRHQPRSRTRLRSARSATTGSSGHEPACSRPARLLDPVRPDPGAQQQAEARVQQLHQLGEGGPPLRADDAGPLGGLNSFYLLVDEAEVYGLPRSPKIPTRTCSPARSSRPRARSCLQCSGLVGLRKRRMMSASPTGGTGCLTPLTASPHWTWFIILYFYVGGIAGSAFFLASLLEPLGPSGRTGPLVAARLLPRVRGRDHRRFLLSVDLTRPGGSGTC